MATEQPEISDVVTSAVVPEPKKPPEREKLPPERAGLTRTFRLAYIHKDGSPDVMSIYIKTGIYPDGRLGEIFITADKIGSLASGALDAAATMVSLLLQYGVPLDVITSKLRHTRYPPNGFTRDEEFPSCSSALDLVAQYLEARYGKKEPLL
jgi:ribonucleoside-diphosphate reductase alpha chain